MWLKPVTTVFHCPRLKPGAIDACPFAGFSRRVLYAKDTKNCKYLLPLQKISRNGFPQRIKNTGQ